MRNLILSAMMLVSAGASAQKLSDVEKQYADGKYEEARQTIDKVMQDPKNASNANAWYRKGQIYSQLSVDSSRLDQAAANRTVALEAFKKYYDLDEKNVMGTLEQNARPFQLYTNSYNAALSDYNSQNYKGAFDNFKTALESEEFIKRKKLTYTGFEFSDLDTGLHLNIAASALKANMRDSAINYYKMLADKKIGGEKNAGIYTEIINYYFDTKDDANANKYIALAQEVYPQDKDAWANFELARMKDDKGGLIAKYEERIQKDPSNYQLLYEYGAEIYNGLRAKEASLEPKKAEYETKMVDAWTKALSINNTPYLNFLMANYYTSKIEDTQEMIRSLGTSAADAKKKQELTKEDSKLWEALLPYAKAAFEGYEKMEQLKGQDKVYFKNAGMLLLDYYDMKKQPTVANTYETRMKAKGV